MKNVFETKGLVSNVNGAILLKDIDTVKGSIQGYFAVFGNVDSDGDMIMPGAFKKTLTENGKRIKHLWQHDPWKPMAAPNVSEDSYGLLFDSTISKTSWGKDALQLYVDGVIDEHSIGYQVMREQKKESYNELQELKLWEGSSVTWGANERALATGMKSLNKDQLFDRMNNVVKSIRNGKFENEEVFDMLEVYLKQLQQYIIDLSTKGSTHAADNAPEPQKVVKSDDFEDSEAILTLLHLNNHSLKKQVQSYETQLQRMALS